MLKRSFFFRLSLPDNYRGTFRLPIAIGIPFICILLLCDGALAQTVITDQSLRYQQQRMVFQQWDQNKFTPTSGFLGLNPYYWLVWGWPYPNYHKTDRRPLSPAGPQTQRMALVAAMNATDNKYKLQSDTLRNTALSQVASQTGLASGADPLWILYYNTEFKQVLNNTMFSILAGLSPEVSAKLVAEGTYGWYKNELDMLKQRVQAAHSADMDRGSRIMAYYRLLAEYRRLSGVWAVRASSAQSTLDLSAQQQKLKADQVTVTQWTPQTDIEIAKKVLLRLR